MYEYFVKAIKSVKFTKSLFLRSQSFVNFKDEITLIHKMANRKGCEGNKVDKKDLN